MPTFCNLAVFWLSMCWAPCDPSWWWLLPLCRAPPFWAPAMPGLEFATIVLLPVLAPGAFRYATMPLRESLSALTLPPTVFWLC
jgi:hypothetical protein